MIHLQSKADYQKYKEQKTGFVFSANWCPDCRFIDSFLPQIESQFSEYTFVHVDRDEHMDICQEENVYGIPSFIVYVRNSCKGTFISKFRKTKAEIIQFLNSIN